MNTNKINMSLDDIIEKSRNAQSNGKEFPHSDTKHFQRGRGGFRKQSRNRGNFGNRDNFFSRRRQRPFKKYHNYNYTPESSNPVKEGNANSNIRSMDQYLRYDDNNRNKFSGRFGRKKAFTTRNRRYDRFDKRRTFRFGNRKNRTQQSGTTTTITTTTTASVASKEFKRRLHITNLHKGIVNSELQTIFSKIGPLNRCGIRWDMMGNSTGSADIEYANPKDAAKAIEQFDNAEIEGVPMTVKYSEYNLNTRRTFKKKLGRRFRRNPRREMEDVEMK